MTKRSSIANGHRNLIARILGRPPGRWRVRTDKRSLDPTSRYDIIVAIEGGELWWDEYTSVVYSCQGAPNAIPVVKILEMDERILPNVHKPTEVGEWLI